MTGFPIVGLGSSAGGLEALQKFFAALPTDSDLAFVVIAHLDPTQKSHLGELLGQKTSLPVVNVSEAIEVAPNQVYVIAPDQELTIEDGVLQPHKPSDPRGLRHPVDIFFRSLAEDQGEHAIGVVLSGSGTNGVEGLRMIKGEGGIVVAQEPDTAGFQGMPHAAVSTGLADLVLAPDDMPDALIRLVRHSTWQQPPADASDGSAELDRVLTLLRARTKQDFRAYKQPTLLRRTRRRMALHQQETLEDYLKQLRDEPDELVALARDLTINVTGFFRDPEAWGELIEQAIKPLLAERSDDAPVRIWVPACSTGEEAYSLAMVMAEQLEAAGQNLEVQIFATDLAEDLLHPARAGLYPAGIAADVGRERLKRFFEEEDGSYRVKKELREQVVFAPQNLLQDPPFSRIDLISCRNLMIYLDPGYQKKLLAIFHFALRENGYLFLGSAESVSGSEDLFQPICRKWRIYSRLGATRHDVTEFPVLGPRVGGHHPNGPRPFDVAQPGRATELARQALLDSYAPASVLIDRRHQIQYFHGATEDYLKTPSGAPTSNLLAIAREGLEALLISAVRQVFESNEAVEAKGRVKRGGGYHPIRLKVAPLNPLKNVDDRVLISFFERDAPETEAPIDLDDAAVDHQLREELKAARDELRLTLEHSEASGEELKASNEEIRAMNEELRVSNEELESSKEELQSLNEELNTVNLQLQAKVEELEGRTSDLNNLLNSTDVATLFLDNTLRIRWYTPAMKNLLELLTTDIGRPVYHFSPKFTGDDFVDEARQVLQTLQPSDAEVVSDQDRWYLRRVIPYRTETDHIGGVVVTFVDFTERKQAELALRESEARLATAIEAAQAGIFEHAVPIGPELYHSERWAEIVGYSKDELPRHDRFLAWLDEQIHPDDRAKLAKAYDGFIEGRSAKYQVEIRLKHKDGHWIWVAAIADAQARDPSGRATNVAGLMWDISSWKQADEALRESEARLRRATEAGHLATFEVDDPGAGEEARVSSNYHELFGMALDERPDFQTLLASVHPDDRAAVVAHHERLAAEGGPFEEEFRIVLPDGGLRWLQTRGEAEPGSDGMPRSIRGVNLDITERKRSEEMQELLIRELNHRVRNTLAIVDAIAAQTLTHSSSLEAFGEAFQNRLHALSETHTLLSELKWTEATLKAIVKQHMSPYADRDAGSITISGPEVLLQPKRALALGLVIHELATNAAKYGALSAGGQVDVTWEIKEPKRRLKLIWAESGGPPVEPPNRLGFGSQLIEFNLAHEFDGHAETTYALEGLTCELTMPMPKANNRL